MFFCKAARIFSGMKPLQSSTQFNFKKQKKSLYKEAPALSVKNSKSHSGLAWAGGKWRRGSVVLHLKVLHLPQHLGLGLLGPQIPHTSPSPFLTLSQFL